MKERYTYDEAFEILQGLTIDHVQFQNNGKPRYSKYIYDKIELQKELDNIYSIVNSSIIFYLGDSNDDGTSKQVITLFFDTITKILYATSRNNPDYSFVSELVGSNKELHYDTFKQVFRTDLDWEWKGLKKRLSRIKSFFGFNESITTMCTISKDDTDTIEDLCLEFSEKWNLKGSWDENEYEPFEKLGYIKIEIFDKYYIKFSVQFHTNSIKRSKGNLDQRYFNDTTFNLFKENLEKFESDLRILLNRISKFGFSVIEVIWGSHHYYGSKMNNDILTDVYDQYTYYFNISHNEKSNIILMNK